MLAWFQAIRQRAIMWVYSEGEWRKVGFSVAGRPLSARRAPRAPAEPLRGAEAGLRGACSPAKSHSMRLDYTVRTDTGVSGQGFGEIPWGGVII